jgi:predicted Ser/Thr protein kinase
MLQQETVPLDSARLNEALAEWELAREQGRPLCRDAFLAEHPDIAEELAAYLVAAEQVDRLAAPLRGALGGKPPLPVPVLEGYEHLEELGRGGMGVVYKARQKGTEQLVALKLLRPDWLASLDEEGRQQAVEQFRREARAAASLRHPNRVRILHLGEHEGRPYYAMELIDGCSLAEKIRQPSGVSTVAAARYLASVAEAALEVHDRGILHRDIKPHNILIDSRTDQALLADFGLALIESGPNEASVRSQTRGAGTLPYMAPEQLEGGDGPTFRSDVYGLGATLYEALAGRPPFWVGTRAELTARIRDEAPAPLRPEANRELEAICLRCLEKAPEKRFTSARELAEALNGFLDSIRYVRQFAEGGTRTLVVLPIILLFHLAVFWMLQAWFVEPVVWLLLFCNYPVLFTTLWMQDRDLRPGKGPNEAPTYWAAWIGHLIASALIAFALRMSFPGPAQQVILLTYPVMSALNGLIYFIEASKMPWKFRWGPYGFWLTGLLMVLYLPWAPLFYCAFLVLGHIAYGLYLRQLARELAPGQSPDFSAHNSPTGPA